jgi:hypothetical protein
MVFHHCIIVSEPKIMKWMLLWDKLSCNIVKSKLIVEERERGMLAEINSWAIHIERRSVMNSPSKLGVLANGLKKKYSWKVWRELQRTNGHPIYRTTKPWILTNNNNQQQKHDHENQTEKKNHQIWSTMKNKKSKTHQSNCKTLKP